MPSGSGPPVTPAGLRESYIYQRCAGNPATHGKVKTCTASQCGSPVRACWSSWGEFDLFSLGDLYRTLNGVLDLRKKILVDLSGITFLDLASTRELAVHAQLYADHLTLHNPSPK